MEIKFFCRKDPEGEDYILFIPGEYEDHLTITALTFAPDGTQETVTYLSTDDVRLLIKELQEIVGDYEPDTDFSAGTEPIIVEPSTDNMFRG